MPFTISHAAIVLPFTYSFRKYFSATGLIIGSMVPDFFYFVFLNPYFSDGHTWWGIFVYDIPLALLLAFLYHQLVKPVLISYLPTWAGNRLQLFRPFNWNRYFRKHYLITIFSMLLGVLTHFFLDGFTHEGGWFVCQIPALQQNITVFQHPMPMWYLMQYLTSLVGLLILFYFFMKIPMTSNHRPIEKRQKIRFWLITALLSAVILWANEYFHHIDTKRLDYLATALGGIFYGLVITAAWYRNKNPHSKTDTI
ncbi:DUF4184 family protein [Chitinophaga sp. 30R24]|uniref:DUF4184 family protein n=1 Tax=Chitinophaga sp. 30R24 TaxID=3248838 RepID=UPI003B8EB03F